MGNDNNTPLTGTTGGGLPADIWHEVMLRIEADIPPTPLPMITPDMMPPPLFPGQNATFGNPVNPPRAQNRRDPAENILLDVLGAILGKKL